MSDEEEIEETSSGGGDFSDFSEDEWNPGDGESEDESDFETATGSSPSPEKKRSRAPPAKKKHVVSTGTTRTGKVMSGSIKALLENAKAKQREKLNLSTEAGPSKNASPTKKPPPPVSEDDDSSSSGDENLVDPSNLDLGSSFFKPVSKEDRIPTPNFDCNIGVGNLTDSGDDDEEEDHNHESTGNQDSSKPVIDVMESHRNFAQTLEDAKENLKRYEANERSKKDEPATDVSKLLALGEATAEDPVTAKKGTTVKKNTRVGKKRTAEQNESGDSDWEEVEDVEIKPEPTEIPDRVDVLLEVPDRRREKLQNDLEVALKRQLNKEKRDQQLLVHQGGFKEWLEQGNYINGILNDPDGLFPIALKLLPSAQAYPKDKADLKYFEAIAKWYKGAMKISADAEMYPPMVDDLDMKASLRKEMESKVIKSKRNFVLIFIIILRAIGVQCRLVVNLVVPPIRPPQSELCRITSKPKADVLNKSKGKAPKKEKKDKDDDEQLSSSKQKKVTATKKASEKPTRSKAATKTTSKEAASTSKAPSSRKSTKTTKVEPETVSSPIPPRITRSRTPCPVIPQLDGLDDVVASPIGKRTRSRTPNVKPPQLKKLLVSKQSIDSPIKTRRTSISNSKNNLQIPKATEIKIQRTKSKSTAKQNDTSPSELFAPDPMEKKTITKPRKSPARATVKSKVERVLADESDAPPAKSSRLSVDDKIDRRVLSTDEDEVEDKKPAVKPGPQKTDFWCEVWSEKEEKWMCVDLFKGKVDSCETLVRSATVPISYVLAWSNSSTVKDVSLRYCPQWHSVNKKTRADQAFIDATLKPFTGVDPQRDKKEDVELQRLIMDRPMPTSISDFKNHPLYALERHLLKFEAIYPPNAPTLGFVRGEAVYARETIHTLHSRELWVKQARVVKPGQTPYKIVTARPKWERATNTVIKDQPLEMFGKWQTAEYEPPVAENGIVPKNAYGNVELFKACMLPIKTVHLPYPGLNKVCKRLKIDYAPAVVGFDFHSGYSHPVYEGYVVCQEFAELVTDEWIKDTEAVEKREAEKFQERVYGNWKKLIKGMLIKKRLQLKYNFDDKDDVSGQELTV